MTVLLSLVPRKFVQELTVNKLSTLNYKILVQEQRQEQFMQYPLFRWLESDPTIGGRNVSLKVIWFTFHHFFQNQVLRFSEYQQRNYRTYATKDINPPKEEVVLDQTSAASEIKCTSLQTPKVGSKGVCHDKKKQKRSLCEDIPK